MKRIIEAGLHLPVEVGGTRFLHAALKAEDWSDLRIRSFLGHLVNREQGIEDHLSRSTRRTYEQTMRRFGIALDLDPSLSHASAESSVRSLNFDTCAEEIAA